LSNVSKTLAQRIDAITKQRVNALTKNE